MLQTSKTKQQANPKYLTIATTLNSTKGSLFTEAKVQNPNVIYDKKCLIIWNGMSYNLAKFS